MAGMVSELPLPADEQNVGPKPPTVRFEMEAVLAGARSTLAFCLKLDQGNHNQLCRSMATIITRYGHSEAVSDPNNEWVVSRLIGELRTERFDEPDDEHTQVTVGNEHWSVSAQVSGLITFDNIDLLEGDSSDLPETMYLRNIPDAQLIAIWQAIVNCDRDSLLDHPWKQFDDLAQYEGVDYYRAS